MTYQNPVRNGPTQKRLTDSERGTAEPRMRNVVEVCEPTVNKRPEVEDLCESASDDGEGQWPCRNSDVSAKKRGGIM